MAAQLEHPFVDPLAVVRMVPYTARNLINPDGFYIRMDMPGVSKDALRVHKDPEKNRLIFIGITPELWNNGPQSQRMYQFSVLLNRDPAKIRIVQELRNGCLRWYFPDTLGFLEPPTPSTAVDQFKGWGIFYPCEDAMLAEEPDMIFNRVNQSLSIHVLECECRCDRQRYYRSEYRPFEIGVVFKHKEHCDGCFFCPEDKEILLVSPPPPAASYINPYLMRGKQGVCESKFIDDGFESHVLLRVDVPDLEEGIGFSMMNSHENLIVQSSEDHRPRDNLVIAGFDTTDRVEFDEVPRHYLFCVTVECDCCRLECRSNDWALQDGVFTAAIFKRKKAP